jgi:hypothetical protein
MWNRIIWSYKQGYLLYLETFEDVNNNESILINNHIYAVVNKRIILVGYFSDTKL